MIIFIYKNKYILILIILLSAVFSINRVKTQNWGDDFAHYILQAKYIVQGIPQFESKIIYNKQISIGPPAYPIGFPLLISPVYALFGNSIEAFLYFIDVCLLLLGIVLFYFYKNFFTEKLSLLLSVLFIFNPWILTMKSHIMSDIPYTLFTFLAITLFFKKNKKIGVYIILGLLIGFLISIRSLGISIALSFSIVLLYSIYKNIKDKIFVKKEFINLFFMNFASIFMLVLFDWLFKMPKEGSYIDQLNFTELTKIVLSNINYYINFIYNYFPFNLEAASQYEYFKENFPIVNILWNIGTMPIRAFIFVALLLGFFYKIRQNFGVLSLFFVIYLGLIMPWNFSPPRYLLPILPVVIFYLVVGLKNINVNKYIYVFVISFVFVPVYLSGIYFLNKQTSIVREGPQIQQAQEAFDYIRQNIPNNSVVVFRKPRALALYTEKRTIINTLDLDFTKLNQDFKVKTNEIYFLLDKKYFGKPNILKIQNEYGNNIQLVWNNKRFYLLKKGNI